MAGRGRFTPGQIDAALRLLCALAVKDTRKNSQEALRLLERGWRPWEQDTAERIYG